MDSDCLDGDEVRWFSFERVQADRSAHPWDVFARAFFFRAESHEEVGRRNFRALVPGHGWRVLGEDWTWKTGPICTGRGTERTDVNLSEESLHLPSRIVRY